MWWGTQIKWSLSARTVIVVDTKACFDRTIHFHHEWKPLHPVALFTTLGHRLWLALVMEWSVTLGNPCHVPGPADSSTTLEHCACLHHCKSIFTERSCSPTASSGLHTYCVQPLSEPHRGAPLATTNDIIDSPHCGSKSVTQSGSGNEPRGPHRRSCAESVVFEPHIESTLGSWSSVTTCRCWGHLALRGANLPFDCFSAVVTSPRALMTASESQ